MTSSCEIEKREILDKFCLSYFVTRSNAYNILYFGFKFSD